uniref:Curli production assembly/transport component CsgG n=1 Tax=Thermodesulfovibrio aggregans TaxID=86166 RepID=A0A7C4EJH8_9BACT
MRKAEIFILSFLIILFSVLSYAEAGVKKIAVLDFDDASITAQLQAKNPIYILMALKGQQIQNEKGKIGRAITDMLITEFVKDGTFKVVERNQLEKILNEQKLSLSGVVDPAEAAKLGKILGVSAVVIGSVTQFSVEEKNVGILGVGVRTNTAKVAVNARLIDTSTAEIISAAEGFGEESTSGVKIGDLIQTASADFENSLLGIATKKAISDIVKQFKEQSVKIKESVINSVVVYVDKVTKTYLIDAGKDSGLDKDMILYVIKIVKEIKSPTTGMVIKRLTDVIAELKITEIEKSCATATCISGKCEEIKENDMVSTAK